MEGFSYYLEESGNELRMAQELIDMYTPLNATQRFFEEADESSENQKVANGATNHLKNAIKALKEMINKAIEAVTNFIQTVFMGKEERSKFEQFKKLVAENPDLKNKKVTVKDFKEFNAKYQKAIAEIDKGIADAQRQSGEEAAKTVDKVTKTVDGIINTVAGSGIATTFTVDLALRMAEGNRHIAGYIKKALEKEGVAINQIEKELGSDRAEAFKKKIDSSAKVLSLHRLKVRLLGQWHKTTSSALNQTVNDFKNLLNPNMSAAANAKRATALHVADDLIGSYNTKTGSNETKTSLAKKGLAVRREVKGFLKPKKPTIEQRLAKDKKDKKRSSVKNFLTN